MLSEWLVLKNKQTNNTHLFPLMIHVKKKNTSFGLATKLIRIVHLPSTTAYSASPWPFSFRCSTIRLLSIFAIWLTDLQCIHLAVTLLNISFYCWTVRQNILKSVFSFFFKALYVLRNLKVKEIPQKNNS